MRRGLELAALGPVVGDHARVGAVVLSPDGDVLAEGWHRAPAPRTPRSTRWRKVDPDAAPRRDGRRHPRTLQPRRPHRPVLRGAHRRRGRPGRVRDRRPRCRRARRCRPTPRRRGRRRVRRARRPGEAFLERWLLSVRLGRPWVTVKWASSLDGRAAAADGTSKWITGAAARQHVHEQRAAHDAILVGTGTVLADDPSLTARGDAGELLADQPLAVVLGDRAGARPTPRSVAHPRGLVHPARPRPGHVARCRCAGTACTRCSSRVAPPSPRRSSPPDSSTSTSCTSPRCCSADPVSPSTTSAWEASPTVGGWTYYRPPASAPTCWSEPDRTVRSTTSTAEQQHDATPGLGTTGPRTTGAPHDRRADLPHPGEPGPVRGVDERPDHPRHLPDARLPRPRHGAEHVAIIGALPDGSTPRRRRPRPRALRVPDRRGLRVAQVRVRPPARRRARHHRGRGRRGRLPARARGPRHRSHQQAQGLPPARGRPRHARRQPRARAAGRLARVRRRRGHPRRPRHHTACGCCRTTRRSAGSSRSTASPSTPSCRSSSASRRRTPGTSTPSATGWATSSPSTSKPAPRGSLSRRRRRAAADSGLIRRPTTSVV